MKAFQASDEKQAFLQSFLDIVLIENEEIWAMFHLEIKKFSCEKASKVSLVLFPSPIQFFSIIYKGSVTFLHNFTKFPYRLVRDN